MAGHQHGSMDPEPHRRMFNAFIKVSIYVTVVVALILIFLAIVGT